MKFQDLPVPILSFRLKSNDAVCYNKADKPQAVKYIRPSEIVMGDFDLYTSNGKAIHAKPYDKATAARLRDELALGREFLAQIEPLPNDGSFELRVAFFFQHCVEMGEVEVAVDEYVADRFKKMYQTFRCEDIEAIRDQMQEDFSYRHGGEGYFFIVAGSALDADLDLAESVEYEELRRSHDEGEADLPGAPSSNHLSATGSSFGIIGRDAFFAASKKQVQNIGDVFVASKMSNRENRSGKNVRLAHGTLRFADMTQTGAIAMTARAEVERLSQENSTYLKKWDEYGDEEGEFLLERARRCGILFYTNAEQGLEETTTVQLTGASTGKAAFTEIAVNEIEAVDLIVEPPSYLLDPDMTFEEFTAEIMRSEREQNATGRGREERKTFKVVEFNEGSNKLTLKAHDLPGSGQLILSIGGEVVQIKRRVQARKKIKDCEAANPQLALILEPGQRITSLRVPKAQKALTGQVKQKVFPSNPPTESQAKAIEIALSTPDIALIQGPPGTGKTTVITAIVERLNQICAEKGINAKGQVLLSGLQHDAVENMISRMSLNGLPCVPKFGRSSADKEAGKENLFESSLSDWCQEVAGRLREKYPELDDAGKTSHAQRLALQYSKSPSAELAIELLQEIASTPVSVTGVSLSDRARNELANQRALKKVESSDQSLLTIRLLRVKSESFLDDGPERAGDVLDELYDLLKPAERKLLSRASAWNVARGCPPFLSDLVKLKAKLLERLSLPPAFHIDKPNETVLELAEEFIDASRRPRQSDHDEKLRILSDFVSNLENNPYGMIDSVSEYSFAFAATCQQSSSKMMSKAKAADDGTAELVYEYVIVDEAARVTPLDLMIPMSQGKKIILVGDHRQLPHIIDKKVEEAITFGGNEPVLEKSMFEQLFTERVHELEEDGICRHVTLDTQFRMHPLLGDFISRNFYERYSEGAEKVKSKLGPEFYSHNLPGMDNKPLAFIDVPRFKSKERKSESKSRYREAEADAIVAQIDEWLSTEEGQKLTYGVISFYKAQAELIKKKLGSRVDGSKIRVGTVDSFQGMEFDVVFLSMVRTLRDDIATHELDLVETVEQISETVEEVIEQEEPAARRGLFRNLLGRRAQAEAPRTRKVEKVRSVSRRIYKPRPAIWPTGDPVEEKQASARFGFLTMYNRLNVSMSRQKKLLVVVGDSNLLKIDLADKYIPGLVDFYLLCLAEGVMLPCK